MKINFIIPFTGKTGGINVVLEYCRLLKQFGHDVKIYYPLLPYWPTTNSIAQLKKVASWIKTALKNSIFLQRGIALYNAFIKVTAVPLIQNLFIRNADICIATAWPTAYDVNKLSLQKGTKFYLVQGYEIWSCSKEVVDNSYRLPLRLITISPWLTNLMEDKFNRGVEAEINNGVRMDCFYPAVEKKCDPLLF